MIDSPAVPSSARLHGEALTLAYGGRVVCRDLHVAIPDGAFTAIIGPNGCGKSTLLRALARLAMPQAGQVWLDGERIHRRPTREVARELGILPQSAHAPEGILVAELVARGRHPHQDWLGRWSTADQTAVDDALRRTRIEALAHRPVDALSGGQRQRVWLAMVLAQQTSILLLDEPTTYLDLAHQVDLLELLCTLRTHHGRTVVAVLHDLNQACRYADHLVVMCDGRIMAQGHPREIVTCALIESVFSLPNCIIPDPVAGTPLIVPLGNALTPLD